MSLTRADVVAYLDGLSSLELGAVIDELQRRLGLAVAASPQVFVTMGAPMLTDEPAYATHRVIVTAIGPRKLRVVQALRERLPLAPQAALALLESLPAVVATDLERGAADELIALLREAGASAE